MLVISILLFLRMSAYAYAYAYTLVKTSLYRAGSLKSRGAKKHGEGSSQFPVYDTYDPNTGYVLFDITSYNY